MSNTMWNKINYIYWAKEAIKTKLSQQDMIDKIKAVKLARKPVNSKTKRSDFTLETYKIDKHGDYYELYMYEPDGYHIYSSNSMDNFKNSDVGFIRPDRLFDKKFQELNGISLRKAFGFADKTIKRCIPKQFYYINKRFCDKDLIASSIDASSQYPSGCLGTLPDAHNCLMFKGRIKPTKEHPFAFYASGHCAEYGVFDTHDWMGNKLYASLFRIDSDDEYKYTPCKDENDMTILMGASKYTMDDVWNYYYNIKKSKDKDSEDYFNAKLIMNQVIGQWHRKDATKKRCMSYEDHGSYQLAHIVAIAIGRGNQKILNKINEIGLIRIAHICVDGIIYLGDDKQGQDESEIGVFAQEFTGCKFRMRDINVYAAEKDNKPVKFKHGSYDLLNDKLIDDTKLYNISDLYNLGRRERIGDIIDD